MKVIKTVARKYPVVSYYVITFAISWGGILAVIGGPSGIPGKPDQVIIFRVNADDHHSAIID